MEAKGKVRYYILIYSLITCLSIILLLVAFRLSDDIWQATILNLSTELLGVVLIFFLVNYIFSIEEWNLTERIGHLLKHLESSDTVLAKKFFIERPDLVPSIRDSVKIDMCGFSLSYGLQNTGELRDRITEGCNVRILISEVDSIAIEMSAARSELPGDHEHFRKRLLNSYGNLKYLYEQAHSAKEEDRLEIRTIPFAPNFGIYSFVTRKNDSFSFIEAYPHKSGFGKQPWFRIVEADDAEWYLFYQRQFQDLWDISHPWSPKVDTNKDDE